MVRVRPNNNNKNNNNNVGLTPDAIAWRMYNMGKVSLCEICGSGKELYIEKNSSVVPEKKWQWD